MYILQVNFEVKDMTPELHAYYTSNDERAAPFETLEGLEWKIWLNTGGGRKVGGIYCFDTREHAEAYMNGPIVASLKANPDFEHLDMQLFEVSEAPSLRTRAPVSGLAAATT